MSMVSVTTEDLLHPEILSKETLVEILLQRQIKLNNSQRLDKEVLVEIFHRTVTPLAQREPRQNRRGKVTAKKIKRLSSSKRKFKLDESKGGESDGKAKSTTNSQRGGLLMSVDVPSSKPRLKPPPVVTNRGIIKLNSSKSSSSTTSPKSSLEGSVAKISLKSPAIVSQSKKVARKRPSSETSSTTSSTAKDKEPKASSESSSTTPESSSPKKIKKITWP